MPRIVAKNNMNRPVKIYNNKPETPDNLFPAFGFGILETEIYDLNYLKSLIELGTVTENPLSGPVLLYPQTILVTPKVGVEITHTFASWFGNPALSYAKQWQVSTPATPAWTNIAGATSDKYTPIVGQVGGRLRVSTTATNVYGTLTSISEPSAVVVA